MSWAGHSAVCGAARNGRGGAGLDVRWSRGDRAETLAVAVAVAVAVVLVLTGTRTAASNGTRPAPLPQPPPVGDASPWEREERAVGRSLGVALPSRIGPFAVQSAPWVLDRRDGVPGDRPGRGGRGDDRGAAGPRAGGGGAGGDGRRSSTGRINWPG